MYYICFLVYFFLKLTYYFTTLIHRSARMRSVRVDDFSDDDDGAYGEDQQVVNVVK